MSEDCIVSVMKSSPADLVIFLPPIFTRCKLRPLCWPIGQKAKIMKAEVMNQRI